MPKGLTAATGMDALTHAIEAYVSSAANPITDACALKAVTMIADSLRTAVNDGANMPARENMAYAQFLAGMAFNNASLGYVHAMAHQLGFLHLPPGSYAVRFVRHEETPGASRVLKLAPHALEVAGCRQQVQSRYRFESPAVRERGIPPVAY